MRGCSLVALCSLAIAALSLWQCGRWFRGDTLASDAQLIKRFQSSRGDLERLRQMVVEDNLQGRIHAQYVDDKSLPTRRIEEYRRLLEKAGITRLWANGRNEPL